MTQTLPRLLVLSQTIPATGTGGGVVLYRMLQQYPCEQLLVIGPAAHASGDRLQCRYEWYGKLRDRLYRSRLQPWLKAADAFGLLPHATNTVKSLVGDFRPQVVLTVMEGFLDRTAHLFAVRQGLPLVVLIHDRPDLIVGVPKWAAAARRRVESAVYQFAAARLCISPQMEAHCHLTYGVPGQVLYPARSPGVAPRPLAESSVLREPGVLRVGFAGSLGLGYSRQLLAMLDTFRAAGAKLYLHARPGSGTAELAEAAPDVVVERGFARTPEETWDRIKRDCDAVILPYWQGADNMHQAMYATHFPSKLTEYTSLGMPIIVVGPAYATGVRWAAEHPGSSVIVTDQLPDRVRDKLIRLRSSAEWRVQLAAAGLAAGVMFDPEVITRQFLTVIATAAGTHPPALGAND